LIGVVLAAHRLPKPAQSGLGKRWGELLGASPSFSTTSVSDRKAVSLERWLTKHILFGITQSFYGCTSVPVIGITSWI
jgi:hypothetical protein